MSNAILSASATGTGSVTLLAPVTNSTQTLTLPDATGTLLSTATPGVPIGGPAFSARNTSNQTGITTATFTKVLFQSEDFDTNNCFASSTFTPTVSGYYQISSSLDMGSGTVSTALGRIFKNGATFIYGAGINGGSTSEFYANITGLVYCNGTTDYIEIYTYLSSTSNVVYQGSTFQAALVRSAT